eukprot:c2312_g1_i1.p1 GENE.c2312_g1_i1~~c2312_g1_i1.p1  ORF type:complete len:475 (+),score=101.20 c2312_g1_i1:33-1457(+)
MLVVLLLVLVVAGAAHRLPPHVATMKKDISVEFPEQYFEQRLDHFHPDDKRTFRQRYYVNDLYFTSPDGPVFIYISGEAPLYGPPRKGSHIDTLAQKHRALLIALEHRYYGQSVPFDKLSADHLKYLNTRQALMDTAAFIAFYQAKLSQYKDSLSDQQQQSLHLSPGASNKWIAFGGSYAGALAAWLRLKFSDLVTGAIVSSAVVNVITDFTAFDNSIARSVGIQCARIMRQASDDVDLFLANNAEDNAFVKNMFNATMLEDGDFRYMIADATSMAVQYGYKERICDPLSQATGRGRMKLLEALAKYMSDFFYPTLEQNGASEYSASFLQNEDVDEDKSGRQWWYQKCSELGFFQVAPEQFSVRSPLVNLEYHRDLCLQLFGLDNLWPDPGAVNAYYGGSQIKISRVFFANGGDDPWRLASVTESSSPATMPAEVAMCAGCGHCVDMKEPHPNDPVQLIELREDIDRFLSAWIS